MRVVRQKVLPKRLEDKRKARRERWWIYNEACIGLYSAISGMQRVLICPAVAKFISFAFSKPGVVFTNVLNVFPHDSYAFFAVLQSKVHLAWAHLHKSTLENRTRYNPTDCFETFPFPKNWQTNPTLESVGKAYYEFRADLMVRNSEGLTKTYNRFHDPNNHDPDIMKLRELHASMDRAALDAYGWDDISTDCEFLLDYEIDEETWGTKKKPYRCRWPEVVHDEVLARLLDLNQKRYREEVAAGLHDKKGKKKAPKKKTKPKAAADDSDLPLFGSVDSSEDK